MGGNPYKIPHSSSGFAGKQQNPSAGGCSGSTCTGGLGAAVSSVTAWAQLVPRNPRKMNPSVPGNEFICCACMPKLTWQEDLPWGAAVDCSMADRVAGIADPWVHTALSGHLHLLKPLSEQLFSHRTPAWNWSGLPDLSCFCEAFVSWYLVAPWHPLL